MKKRRKERESLKEYPAFNFPVPAPPLQEIPQQKSSHISHHFPESNICVCVEKGAMSYITLCAICLFSWELYMYMPLKIKI